jgi:hypothetical protein
MLTASCAKSCDMNQATHGLLLTTALLRNVVRSGGALTGSLHGIVSTSDIRPHRHIATLTVQHHGEQLVDQLTARGIDELFLMSSLVSLRSLTAAYSI